ncbi:MAG: 2'-5' RNA ligase family protein [Ignavibacteria bacterium]|nr:2'-5' RNA ligase family protein [Bacteroidota bacterium]MBL7128150.1 2'-5' RNA ligase family protein [Ignavibacteria bacterium]
MKAAIALLTDYGTQNFVRRIVLELNRKYGISFITSLLPAHVSLKQPFLFISMDRLEQYFNKLAEEIEPFVVELDRFYHTQWSGYGILGLNVRETNTLRKLHNRINIELADLFENTSSPHDGDRYHFHLTIEVGKVEVVDVFRNYYKELSSNKINLKFTARKIALFYYDGEPIPGSFTTYKVLELGSRRH